ncbi:MAG: class I tRNA ligase family protein, partial [Bacteroidetes bacterium]|nr:class I tRNA ligase family protein [Bacteroidota bacterium]
DSLREDLVHEGFYFFYKDKFIVEREVEKMSKRWQNVVTPDSMVSQYGADTFRMYEMFLGPITDSKPWNTHGIDGVFKFLRKFYNLFHNKENAFEVSNEKPSKDEFKALHTCIQKVENDIEKLSFNTCVSHFMICVNELQALKCNKREILEPLVVLISPFAPHLAEELWQLLGNEPSVTTANYPTFNPTYLVESELTYPVMINGKMRAKIILPAEAGEDQALETALSTAEVQKWTDGMQVRKVVFVPKKILNLVVG